jgi:hypothetical protein
MGNKIWIGVLAFCAFIYAAVCLIGLWLAITQHAHILHILNAAVGAGLIWLAMLRALIRRIKYGPNGSPPDSLENFHVDF